MEIVNHIVDIAGAISIVAIVAVIGADLYKTLKRGPE